MLLSVIVPAYNAGEYLKPCIESLLVLPWDMEIIVVDDGSTDGEVEQLSDLDCRLSIIRQANQGVSVARNAGLKLAKGDWVWFVDADDKVKVNPNLNPNSNLANYLCVLPFIWEENGVAKRYEAYDGEIPYNLWRCWFRRDILLTKSICFVDKRKYAEDQELILKYLLATGIETKALRGPIYHYTMRPSGAMMRKNVRWKQRWDLWCVLWNFFGRSMAAGKFFQPWVRQQLRRLIKNLIII